MCGFWLAAHTLACPALLPPLSRPHASLLETLPLTRTRCIDTAAQHAANKGRGISGGSGGGGSSSGSSGGGNLTKGRSSPVYLPESLSQAIYVPTQKITTLHPGVGAAAVAVATALASPAADDAAAPEGGDEEAGAGEDDVDVRLCSPALSASPALLQSVTGELLFSSKIEGHGRTLPTNEAGLKSGEIAISRRLS